RDREARSAVPGRVGGRPRPHSAHGAAGGGEEGPEVWYPGSRRACRSSLRCEQFPIEMRGNRMGPLLRTIVLDSDPDSRASIRRALAGVPFVIVVAEFSDLRDAVLPAPALRPDVL